jgi:hypothetical protein
LGTGQFNGGNDTPEHRAPAQLKRTFTVGLLALVLLILNTAVFTFSYFAVGDGIDAGLGLASPAFFFTFPLALYTIFLGILSLTGKQGRIPGTIALSSSTAVLLFSIYQFFKTLVF